MSHPNRYERQIRLAEIGEIGQKKLAQAKVLVVGAGGLGSPVLFYLAAAGIGQIGIIDADRVSANNLQRQILFTEKEIGKSKTQAAQARLLELNSEIKITAHDQWLNPKDVISLFENHDLIIDGSDNFETKYLINDAAVKLSKPWVYASILGFEGQLSIFHTAIGAKDRPCYRCIYPDTPKTAIPNCAESGILGALAGWVGSAQALLGIQWILDDSGFEIQFNQLKIFSGSDLTVSQFKITKNPECKVCSKLKDEISVQNFSTRNAHSLRNPITWLDVRELEEFEEGTLEDAVNWPLSLLRKGKMPELNRETPMVVFCQVGFRSLEAQEILVKNGFISVENLAGGINARRFTNS